MATIVGLNVPQSMSTPFSLLTQIKPTENATYLTKFRPTISRPLRKSFAARCPFLYWGTFWRSLTPEMRHNWQEFHTKTGARGWGTYIQDNNNRRKNQLLATDLHDVIVKPTGRFHLPRRSYFQFRIGQTFSSPLNRLSNPAYPSKPQHGISLDLTNHHKLRITLKIRSPNFQSIGTPQVELQARRYFYQAPRHYYNWKLYDQNFGQDGSIDIDWTCDFYNSYFQFPTEAFQISIATNNVWGDLFFDDFTAYALLDNGTYDILNNTQELSDFGVQYKGNKKYCDSNIIYENRESEDFYLDTKFYPNFLPF
jgi:hypothetical protein